MEEGRAGAWEMEGGKRGRIGKPGGREGGSYRTVGEGKRGEKEGGKNVEPYVAT